jgi:uncharacterized membrane protein YfcA
METMTAVDLPVALAVLGGALVTGALGYGFSTITVPIALLYIPGKTLNPALVLLELFTNSLGLFMQRRAVPTIARRMLPMALGLLPGIVVGAWVLSHASSGPLKFATYAVLLPLVLAQTAGLRWPIRHEKTAAVPTGFGIGALYSATTISGPPLALFLNNQDLAPTEFRAAVYLIRVAESVTTTIVFLYLGLFSGPSLSLAGHLVPSMALGLPVGIVLLRRLDPESFRRVCMGVNAAFIAFGLARSMIERGVLPVSVAYGAMVVVVVVELILVGRYFVKKRLPATPAVEAPRA